jgi:hypothetical protein
MEPADAIQEAAPEEGAGSTPDDRFRGKAALWIAVLAALLAVSSLGGGNVAEDMVNNNIHASDTWAFYQAKNVRQTTNKLAAEELELQLLIHGKTLGAAARKAIEDRIKAYRDTAARYESEPDPEAPDDPLKGEGKKQLLARAKDFEKQRDHAIDQDPNFDYAEVFFQIAIVLGSVAILALSRPILLVSMASGALATLLMLNGFFLWFKLPF